MAIDMTDQLMNPELKLRFGARLVESTKFQLRWALEREDEWVQHIADVLGQLEGKSALGLRFRLDAYEDLADELEARIHDLPQPLADALLAYRPAGGPDCIEGDSCVHVGPGTVGKGDMAVGGYGPVCARCVVVSGLLRG